MPGNIPPVEDNDPTSDAGDNAQANQLLERKKAEETLKELAKIKANYRGSEATDLIRQLHAALQHMLDLYEAGAPTIWQPHKTLSNLLQNAGEFIAKYRNSEETPAPVKTVLRENNEEAPAPGSQAPAEQEEQPPVAPVRP